MGVTIHYKGRLNHPSQITEMVAHVQQWASARGWSWTHIDDDWDQERDAQLHHVGKGHIEIVGNAGLKGLSLDIDPDCEGVLLLFDASGRLRSPLAFCENSSTEEGETIAVKTQFAPPEAHIQIIELLKDLKEQYIADLEVMDEGKYWETNDRNLLEKQLANLRQHIDFLSEALQSEHCKGLRDLTPEELAKEIERMLGKT